MCGGRADAEALDGKGVNQSSLAVEFVRAGGNEYIIVGAARFTEGFGPWTGGEKLKMSSKKDHFS